MLEGEMSNVTDEATASRIGKLPQWAQCYIHQLRRQRDDAEARLQDAADVQTPSPIWVERREVRSRGWTVERQYIQSDRVCIEHNDVFLEVYLPRFDDGQRRPGIELRWADDSHSRAGWNAIGFTPATANTAYLVNAKHMR
eukprot:GHVR01027076.1.p1 GENE.GHVR01027076.1~~GHVR01027076.1.p1  ORF type:complete len:141 (+),score=13.37 GHVR01027076.1:178-600(+)